MATDKIYQDNVILKKDAFQNLLTNIKNYPIIDIDYMTEIDTDELHGDQIWSNYTDGMPCIKITYGDERTTKGNVIFAEELRRKIYDYKKQLIALKNLLNEYIRLYNRWYKVWEENQKIWEDKDNQIQRYMIKWAEIQKNKLAFLKTGWNLLYYNISDLFNITDNHNYPTLSEEIPADAFEYHKLLLNNASDPTIQYNLEYITLNKQHKNYLVTSLQMLRDAKISDTLTRVGKVVGDFFFTPEERHTISNFISFISSYDYISILDAIKLAGYDYTSSQILTLRNNEILVDDSDFVAQFTQLSSSATFDSSAIYYKQRWSSTYQNTSANSYNSANPITYYKIDPNPDPGDDGFIVATGITSENFREQRHLLFEKIDELICYETLPSTMTAQEFATQRDTAQGDKYGIWIKNTDSIRRPAAITAILPQIKDDVVWDDNPDNIHLDFDALFNDYRNSIQTLVDTLNDVVEPRLAEIRRQLNKYNLCIHSDEFTITLASNHTITRDNTSENGYSVSTAFTSAEEEDFIPNIYPSESNLQNKENLALQLRVDIVEKAIEQCNSDIDEAAEERGRTLYGYKYVKVGSNITWTENQVSDATYTTTSEMTFPEVDPATPQRNGHFRVTINGHTYEIGIKGLEYSDTSAGVVTVGQQGTGTDSDQLGDAQLNPAQNTDSSLGTSSNYWDNAYISVVNTPRITDSDGIVEVGNPGTGSESSQQGTATLIPATNTNSSLGENNNPWDEAHIGTGYFDTIQIGDIVISGNDGGGSSGQGSSTQYILGQSGWTNELTGPLYFGNVSNNTFSANVTISNTTNDGVKTTIEGVTTNGFNASGTITGDDSASISTAGGIYAAKNIWAARVFNAVFNDYAECRTTIDLTPGHVVIDQDDGSLACSSKRLQPGAQVISDTYGHLMGATDKATTPIAVAGRVLVYTYQPRENYHAGMAVCSAPDGTVDIMSRAEICEYPDCIVGIVSEIPQYETWGSDNVKVDGRIWIKVR